MGLEQRGKDGIGPERRDRRGWRGKERRGGKGGFPKSPRLKQESCAVAKMTAQCALYGALKMFMTP